MDFSNKKSGFTLIELLVVIFIIGVLASLILTGAFGSKIAGQNAESAVNLQAIQRAMNEYWNDHKRLPGYSNGDTGSTVFNASSATLEPGYWVYCLQVDGNNAPYLNDNDHISIDHSNEGGEFVDSWGQPYHYVHFTKYKRFNGAYFAWSNGLNDIEEFSSLSDTANFVHETGSSTPKDGDGEYYYTMLFLTGSDIDDLVASEKNVWRP